MPNLAIQPLAHKDFLTLAQLTRAEMEMLFNTAASFKADPSAWKDALRNKVIVLLFEKSSLRTRITFEVGTAQMGGTAIFMDHQKVKLGERESLRDYGKNLECWTHGIVARTYKHRSLTLLAQETSIPVINGLTDFLHPCQALADYFTLREARGSLDGARICYVGDGNNTCHSLIFGAGKLGIQITVVAPEGFEPSSRVVNEAMGIARETGAKIRITDDLEAVKGHVAVYTDTWVSMGQEAEAEERLAIFSEYQVDDEMMEKAGKDAYFMHCLPAHRGAEVTPEVIDSGRSLVYRQAQNRLFAQNAILIHTVAARG